MYWFLSIVLSAIGGLVLFMLGPLVGGIIAFGIVVGCLFRGLYLLNEIHKKVVIISPKKDQVQLAYDQYIESRETYVKSGR